MIAKTFYEKFISRILLPGLFLFIVNISYAQVVLRACFTDNMVLQQQTKVNLCGTEHDKNSNGRWWLFQRKQCIKGSGTAY